MTDGPIVTRAMIRARARAAFAAGQSRDSHNMNHGAEALKTWLAEFDAQASAKHHITLSAPCRLDVAQVSV